MWQVYASDHRETLQQIIELDLLADTGWSPEKQLACLYSLSKEPERHYHQRTIAKRTGGERRLLVPDGLLKRVQRQILQRHLARQPISIYATAYHKGAFIRDNAAVHVGQPMLLKLDVRDFFSSILFSDVLSACFPSTRYVSAVGVLLTSLCCYQGYLPQGAPTSPAISNLVLRGFDDWLGRWCAAQEIRYTRYSDDMTFSGDFDAALLRRRVAGALQARGFTLHQQKTRLCTSNMRQMVTGVVVNETPQAAREYRRDLRQAVYYCKRYGVLSHLARRMGVAEADITPVQAQRYLQSLLSKLHFVLQLRPDDKAMAYDAAWVQQYLHVIQKETRRME